MSCTYLFFIGLSPPTVPSRLVGSTSPSPLRPRSRSRIIVPAVHHSLGCSTRLRDQSGTQGCISRPCDRAGIPAVIHTRTRRLPFLNPKLSIPLSNQFSYLELSSPVAYTGFQKRQLVPACPKIAHSYHHSLASCHPLTFAL